MLIVEARSVQCMRKFAVLQTGRARCIYHRPMAIAAPKPGNRRVTGKEQFYTPPAVAEEVVDLAVACIGDLSTRVVIEPAGGTGAFIDALRSRGVQHIESVDIEPHHPEVRHGDFLETSFDVSDALTISNPPFGRNNARSIPFFNHAAQWSEFIVFIVPRSWRKWSVQNKLDARFHLVRDVDLAINYVDVHGASAFAHDRLRTCAQVWERRGDLRPRIDVEDCGFIARCGPEDADVALTIFGYGCGTVRTEFPRQPNTTQMFLRLTDPRALAALQTVDYSRFSCNTAYTEALSLKEINALLNEHVFGDMRLLKRAPA